MTSEYPFEEQIGQGTCGAAALCMAYRSLGLGSEQAAVWSAIGRRDDLGRWGAPSHRLAADARGRGLDAVVIDVRDPWDGLHRCLERGVRVILNVALSRHAGQRHFASVARIEGDEAVVHDPHYGRIRRSRSALLELWPMSHAHGARHILIGMACSEAGEVDCAECGRAIPSTTPCPVCGQVVPMRPAAAVGCTIPECRGRLWRQLYCPFCDGVVCDTDASSASPAPAEKPMPVPDPLATLASAMDQYQSQLRVASEVAPTQQIRQELQQTMEHLKQLHAEFVAVFKQQDEQLTAQLKAAASSLSEARERVAESAKTAAEKKAKTRTPGRRKKEPPAIDPELGARLRAEILEGFGNRSAPVDHGPSWAGWPHHDG